MTLYKKAKDNIYAFFFVQEELMSGMGLQGANITQIFSDQQAISETGNRIYGREAIHLQTIRVEG